MTGLIGMNQRLIEKVCLKLFGNRPWRFRDALDRFFYIHETILHLEIVIANILAMRQLILAASYSGTGLLPGNFSGKSSNRHRAIAAKLRRQPHHRFFRK